ncbi:hypothetical protein AB1Y20_002602 [Prymnesium parvum]|uniref:Calmodulin-lysine N-methyltransferase n=1 Tax=Prymnesium parvum TaxID=97485 RepID=A0AB34J9R2_PRYPA
MMKPPMEAHCEGCVAGCEACEEGEGWYSGGRKTLTSRRFVLPRAGASFCVAQGSGTSTAELFARGDGHVVWEAADAVLRWLDDEYAPHGLCGRVVLELGAGTGVCGLACALLGASRVVLTDLPQAVPLLRRNAAGCAHLWPTATRVEVAELTWGDEAAARAIEGVDLVLACDCVYQPAHYRDLARTLDAFEAETIVAWLPRDKSESAFLDLLRSRWTMESFDVSGVRICRAVCVPHVASESS